MDTPGLPLLPKRRSFTPPMPRTRLLLAILAVGFFSGSACSNQAEGARCDVANGSDDCDTGLVCTPASQLAIGAKETGATWAVCCPPRGATQPTVEACYYQSTTTSNTGGAAGTGGTDSGAAGDSSTPATGGGPQNGGAAGTDAGRDAANKG